MPISKAQQRAVAKYCAANYDRIELKVPKGYKAALVAASTQQGESLNGFINRLLREAVPPQDTAK